MKNIKIIGFVSLLAISVSLMGCNNNKQNSSNEEPGDSSSITPPKPSTPIENDTDLPNEIIPLGEPGIQIHYRRFVSTTTPNDSYSHWGLWLWGENTAGSEYEFNYADDYGVVAYYPMSLFNCSKIGFIVKQLFSYAGDNVWKKDYDQDRFLDIRMLQADENQSYHIYIASNNRGQIYCDAGLSKLVDCINVCEFSTNNEIVVEGNNPISDVVLKKNGQVCEDVTMAKSKSDKKYTITLNESADIKDSYVANITFESEMNSDIPVSIRRLYNASFDAQYNYDGELGAIRNNGNTTFKVWSPISQEIKLRIYDSGTPISVDAINGDDTYEEVAMEKDEKGVFQTTINDDLAGKYYTYFVKNGSYPEGKEIVDPYAKSAGVNGLRGMVVDFSKTNPDDWSEVDYLQYDRKELTIYETHIAELTCSETWGGTADNAKKYNGFYESGTTYTSGGKTVSTGFDHIKELGVNAVQIIPFFDQANDEINTEFNWGYNPLNYNVVEGCYSSNPFDGYVRIRELKSLIQAYNNAGIAIMMDVVYNHVNGLSGSNFDVLMPFYYYRYNADGTVSNGSGCGNETASDKYMFRKFMIDSVAFWTEEYKLGGFRFDLMGLHDVETMNQVAAKAKTINPYITIYGEPWTGGGSAMPSGFTPATQINASKYVGYGQFNDLMRDKMIASGMSLEGNRGWINQTKWVISPEDIVAGIKGITGSLSVKTDDPNKTVNYVTCHDNYTLHDRILVSGVEYDPATYEKMNVLANSIVFCSQGTTFMLAGEEMLRTKVVYNTDGTPKEAVDKDGNPLGRPEVSGNSYCSPYKTNEINYQWKIDHPRMMENYKKLIALKQTASGLQGVEPNSVELLQDGAVIKVTFVSGNQTYVAYHANGCADGSLSVDTTGYDMYLDTLGNEFNASSMNIHPFESLILYK